VNFMAYTVLVAEDEAQILRMLKTYLKQDGYEVFEASDGQMAIDIFKQAHIDFVCLDVMMPKLTGYEVAKMIRSSSNVPIILLTALDSEEDILKGYSLFIDDYITKPFNPKVLLAKINNILKRNNSDIKKEYMIGELKIDFINEKVYLKEKEITVSKKEFELLSFFIKNEDKVCSRDLILDEVWGIDSDVDIRVVDTYIKQLRKKMLPCKYIKTIFKKGYQFSLK